MVPLISSLHDVITFRLALLLCLKEIRPRLASSVDEHLALARGHVEGPTLEIGLASIGQIIKGSIDDHIHELFVTVIRKRYLLSTAYFAGLYYRYIHDS